VNWFKHDTDATQDAKLKKLIIRYGPVGYAVYFHCLELIASDVSEMNLTFELEHDSEIIADDLHIPGTAEKSGIQIVEEIMRYIIELDLFSESKGHIFCFKLLKRIDASMTSNERFRAMIVEAKCSHDDIMAHHDKSMTPSCKPYKPYIPSISSPEPQKEKTKEGYSEDFLSFYEAYPRKVGKQAASKKYRALVKAGMFPAEIVARLDKYKEQIAAQHTTEQYIRHPATFLGNLDDYSAGQDVTQPRHADGMIEPLAVSEECPKCGETIPAGEIVCPGCGAVIDELGLQ